MAGPRKSPSESAAQQTERRGIIASTGGVTSPGRYPEKPVFRAGFLFPTRVDQQRLARPSA